MNTQTLADAPRGVDTNSDNKAIARRVLEEIFPANDVDALREVIGDDCVNHEAPPGTPPGLGAITIFMSLLNRAFSNQKWEIHDLLAEGDKVVIRCTHSGVHTGEFFGVQASGRSFAYNQIHILRMRDGKGREHWAVRDDASLMRQLTAWVRTSDPAADALPPTSHL